ncbi:hypothetical protein PHYBOEH_007974 [Phytophthora boehmeriae]|uniref:Uncharacterized protein n=1 Tax=Phytophthora boehmeriae TaxID=109152 RepID=A0A8T1W6B9_9STRA|nr:hypothetical protein PHYBOEH_007974 [Phytophthora boehmeriae]
MKVVLNQAECVAIFCIAVLIVYVSPFFVFRSPKDWDFIFIWDDRSNFVENDVLQSSFSLDTIYAMLTMIRINVYEPLAWILKFAVTKLVGLDSWWVRLVSVIVHVGAGMVLAKAAAVLLDIDYLLAKLNRSGGVQTDMQQLQSWSNRHFPACCLSAVLFLIHPIHVEVIAWPSAQSYTLAALFSNLAILVHVQDIDKKLLKAVTENAKRDEAKDFEVLFGDGITRSKLLSSGMSA